MTQIVRCKLPRGVTEENFGLPLPGMPNAIECGCTCPKDGSDEWPTALTFASDCPVHELEKATEH